MHVGLAIESFWRRRQIVLYTLKRCQVFSPRFGGFSKIRSGKYGHRSWTYLLWIRYTCTTGSCTVAILVLPWMKENLFHCTRIPNLWEETMLPNPPPNRWQDAWKLYDNYRRFWKSWGKHQFLYRKVSSSFGKLTVRSPSFVALHLGMYYHMLVCHLPVKEWLSQ